MSVDLQFKVRMTELLVIIEQGTKRKRKNSQNVIMTQNKDGKGLRGNKKYNKWNKKKGVMTERERERDGEIPCVCTSSRRSRRGG